MKNKIKFLAMMLIGILLSVNVWGETEKYTFSSFEAADDVIFEATNYTIVMHKNAASTAPTWNDNSLEARLYAKGSLVISSTQTITKIEYNYAVNENKNGISPTIDGVSGGTGSEGTWNSETKIWTGSSKEVTFSTGGSAGNLGFKWIEVTFSSAPATHYTVSFYNNGDYVGEFTTTTYNGKEYLDELPDMTSAISPHPSSTTFAGWTTDEINGETQTTITADNLVDIYTEITEDISVNALWASVDSDHKVTFTASELSQSPVGGYYDWTIDGINFYYKQSDGTIYSSSYFEVLENKRFTVNAGNRIINKIDFTVYSSTFCIGSMTDGKLSSVSSDNKQTATNINAYYTQGIASDDHEADFSQMVVTCYTNYITHYTACSNEVNVNKGSMTGGDVTISADKVCADGDGGSVTVTPNPNEHYSCTGVTATFGSVTGPVAGVYTVSGITAATTISATFAEDAKATVTWSVNGVTKKSSQVYVGETDAAPAVDDDADIPTTCADAFVGWSASTMVGEGHGAPTDLFNTTSPAVLKNETYYAVFATEGSGSGTVFHSQPGTITSGDYYLVDTYNGVDFQGNATGDFWALKGGLDDESGTKGGIPAVDVTNAVSVSGNVLTLNLANLTLESTPSVYTVTFADDSVSFALKDGDIFYNAGNNVNADMVTARTYRWKSVTNETDENDGRHMLFVSRGTGSRCLMYNDHTSGSSGATKGNQQHKFKMYATTNSNTGGTKGPENSYGSGKLYFIPAVSVTYSNYVTSCAAYTVTFKSNGADVTTVSNVAPGQQVTAPTLAYIKSEVAVKNVCTEYLIGWSTDSHYSNPSAAPDNILKPNAEGKITIPSNITSDVTYYAVYADVVQQ